jgi:hypothetical protein
MDGLRQIRMALPYMVKDDASNDIFLNICHIWKEGLP